MDVIAHKKRMEWFENDRFGMFIHWGLYAIPAKGEWIRSLEKISNEDYEKYFEQFDPIDFDAKKWAKVAKQAGMKYAVLTAKHHDGFCLFDSKLTEYKSTNTKFKRDIIAEYVEAFREEGIKVGLYYSLLDWYHPDYYHYGDLVHPERENEKFKDVKHDFDNYLDYMHGQIRELCTNYGKIDILWFDFSYCELGGEKWRATELVEMVRKLQPDVILDNRLDETPNSLLKETPKFYCGDFVSPEMLIPPDGMFNCKGERVPWEACLTLNNNWGYHRYDNDYKPASAIIHKLVECVSKGGNMLLNIGPDARGNFPKETIAILKGVGEWMGKNSESIYGCSISDVKGPDMSYVTQKEKKVYLHVMDWVIGPIPVKGITKDIVKSIKFLSTGAELNITEDFTCSSFPEFMFMYYGTIAHGTYALPDPIDSVIEIELK